MNRKTENVFASEQKSSFWNDPCAVRTQIYVFSYVHKHPNVWAHILFVIAKPAREDPAEDNSKSLGAFSTHFIWDFDEDYVFLDDGFASEANAEGIGQNMLVGGMVSRLVSCLVILRRECLVLQMTQL